MAPTILGLDIGGANLKAATTDKRALSVPFPLWKQPDKLPAALAELVAQFPDAEQLAVTMTGELCDCFETKRDGVNAIIAAVRFAGGRRPIRVWSTDGVFLNSEEAKRNHMKVAAANWHALATFAGRFVPDDGAQLIDIGSTTSDFVPIYHGVPTPHGSNDYQRLSWFELVYAGVKRTPVCAVHNDRTAAELFATTHDVYIVLGMLPESSEDRDTADGRPATRRYALARLARMLGADLELITEEAVVAFANDVHRKLCETLENAAWTYHNHDHVPPLRAVIISGSGEFLARLVLGRLLDGKPLERLISLNDKLGPAVSACAPAYAIAVLAAERRP